MGSNATISSAPVSLYGNGLPTGSKQRMVSDAGDRLKVSNASRGLTQAHLIFPWTPISGGTQSYVGQGSSVTECAGVSRNSTHDCGKSEKALNCFPRC